MSKGEQTRPREMSGQAAESKFFGRSTWKRKFQRIGLLVAVYALLSLASALVGLMLRLDFRFDEIMAFATAQALGFVVVVKLVALASFGQFGSLLTYFSLSDAKRVAYAVGASTGLLLLLWGMLPPGWVLPRSVIVIDALVFASVLVGFRIAIRVWRESLAVDPSAERNRRVARVAILGAGESGSALFREMHSKPALGMNVACFVDDDSDKIGGSLHGRPIVGPLARLPEFVDRFGINKVVIAMPKATPATIRTIVEVLNQRGIEHHILPSVTQMLRREVGIEFLRRVEPEDLLGREPVALDSEGLRHLIEDRVVMVTGAGGSIGSELCRQIASCRPKLLVLVERSEPALFQIEQELHKDFSWVPQRCSVVNVCDPVAFEQVMRSAMPEVLFHAAAHKHVPLMEEQPAEAVWNNAIGTETVARAAAAVGVKKFVLISTDKAINPTGVMGASKRLAELVLQREQERSPQTRFVSVRFGNVLGSSGSVIPTFHRQLAEGGPLTVTHPDVTRYFMSIPEAVGLVLQAAVQAEGGEVFVLDMGHPIRIVDLATQMIELSGLRPGIDIQIQFTGLRPGEKLYEEPIHASEAVEDTAHPKVKRLRGGTGSLAPERLDAALKQFEANRAQWSAAQVRAWLKELVPEFRSGAV